MSVKTGQLIKLNFEGREFEVIVIDPSGIGIDQPSVGFGFRMMEKHAGIPNTTLSSWVREIEGDKNLELPSGKQLRVREIKGQDKNNYSVIEASDWFDLAFDLLENPGRTTKAVKSKLLNFIKWFTIKGFYAEAYTVLKGKYTTKDSRALSAWMEARIAGIYNRKTYTDFLQNQGCTQGYQFATWTDRIYEGLFSIKAKEMKEQWQVVEGTEKIARNHIPEILGLNAVAYCERMVPDLFVGDLEKAHSDAIDYAKKKFFGGNQGFLKEDEEDIFHLPESRPIRIGSAAYDSIEILKDVFGEENVNRMYNTIVNY